jgi:hypothetical protein
VTGQETGREKDINYLLKKSEPLENYKNGGNQDLERSRSHNSWCRRVWGL